MAIIDKVVTRIVGDSSSYEKAISRSNEATKRFAANTKEASSKIELTFATLGKAAGALGIAYTVKEVAQSFLEVGKAAESLERQFATAFQGTAAREMEYIAEQADRLGINFRDTASEYAKFAVAAQNANVSLADTKNVFEAVSEASAALALSQEQTGRAFTALTQIASKGKLSMEELSGQLAEAIPGALGIFARALGVGVGELQEMVSRGEVLADDVLPKLAAEFRATFNTSSAQEVEGINAALGRLSNAFSGLGTAIANSGVIDALSAVIAKLTTVVEFATRAYNYLARVFSARDVTDSLEGLANKIEIVGERLGDSGIVGEAKTAYFRALQEQSEESVAALDEVLGRIDLLGEARGYRTASADLEEYLSKLDDMQEAQKRAADTAEQLTVTVSGTGNAKSSAGGGKKSVASAVRQAAEESEAAKKYMDDLADAFVELEQKASQVGGGLSIQERLGITDAEMREAVNATQELGKVGEESANKYRDAWQSAQEQIITLGATTLGSAIEGQKIEAQNIISSLGGIAGAAIGTYFGGPLGTAVGGTIGGAAGSALGGLFGGGGGPDQYRFGFGPGGNLSASSAFGNIGAFAGEGADVQAAQQFLNQIAALENQFASLMQSDDIERVSQSLDGFRTATRRMAEGGFDAAEAAKLLESRFGEIFKGLPQFKADIDAAGSSIESIAQLSSRLTGMSTIIDEFGVSAGTSRAILRQLVGDTEDWTAASARLIDQYNVVGPALANMGKGLEELSVVSRLRIADEIVSLAGGIEQFATASNFFYENFYSEAERAARSLSQAQDATQEFNESFNRFGKGLIDTKAELRTFIESLDLTGDAGQRAYIAALEVAQAIATLEDASVEAVDDVQDVAQALENFDLRGFRDRVISALGAIEIQWADTMADLYRRVNEITGAVTDFSASLQIATAYANRYLEASQGDAPLEYQRNLLDRAMQEYLRYLQELETAYRASVQKQIEAERVRLEAEIDAINAAFEARRDALEQERDRIQEAYEARRTALQDEIELTREWASVLNGANSLIDELRLGIANPMSAGGRFGQAGADLERIRDQYRIDPSALNAQALVDAINRRLALAQDIFQRPSDDYLREYNEAMEELSRIQERALEEQQRLKELEEEMQQLEREQAQALESIDDRIGRLANEQQQAIEAANRNSERLITALETEMERVIQAYLSTNAVPVFEAFAQEYTRLAQEQMRQVAESAAVEWNNLRANVITAGAIVQLAQELVGGFQLFDIGERQNALGAPASAVEGAGTAAAPMTLSVTINGATDPVGVEQTLRRMAPTLKRMIQSA